MKAKIELLIVVFLLAFVTLNAQEVPTVEATSSEISKNLDLEAVASVFGASRDLEDFEKRLNDPEAQLSNLDLNEDGEVDYLRVIETVKGNTHLVTIQAVVGPNQYQDVAVIDVEQDDEGVTHVQVIGDVYLYGPGYMITPLYVRSPLIYTWFWGPDYALWVSPYYWGYYPAYFRPWKPYAVANYLTRVRAHVNVNNTYKRTVVRKSQNAVPLHHETRRNDIGTRHPHPTKGKPTTRPGQRPKGKSKRN